MAWFPEEIGLVCGNDVDQVDELVFPSLGRKDIIAISTERQMPRLRNRRLIRISTIVFLSELKLMPDSR